MSTHPSPRPSLRPIVFVLQMLLTQVAGCYPFQDDDPLIVKDCPHIYFAGNQPTFETRVIHGPADQKVTLIAVPKFKQTRTLVLIDLETMAVETIEFNVAQPGS